ncbi:pyridoxamine 5'-phosphate oxidase family protein [Nocardia stercoris]|uniref:pyridoxamine 5'-phosphate oxidase family protein n=1 Tax=Nocardia stercoris TaxID=2483361 RepID=UPI00131A4713|nr:pyridoxamine 5'-phosphate oxidase family protein [Nocardia stercoris]
MDPAEWYDVARRILDANRTGFLTTVCGGARTRMVEHKLDDAGIWFATSPRSRKFADIRSDPAVTYAVEDRAAGAYVTLYGPATVVDDLATRREQWSERARPYFPGGPEGDDFVLIRLVPDRIELWSLADSVLPEPRGLVPAVLVRSGDDWAVAAAERQ